MKKIIVLLAISAALCVNATAQNSESFGGLGMSVRVGKQGVTVAGVIPNSPADHAGLQAGDIIISAGGITLSSLEPQKQVSLLRGKEGTIANLIVERNGKQIAISAKRTGIAVQPLESKTILDWYGKQENLSAEEINHLALQKMAEGYEALGTVQNGLPISKNAENLNSRSIQHISMKKVEEKNAENKIAPSNAWQLNSANRETISFSLANETKISKIAVLNAKGATVWQKNLGKLPAGANNIDWSGANLPVGSYHIMLEADGKALAYKFDLR